MLHLIFFRNKTDSDAIHSAVFEAKEEQKKSKTNSSLPSLGAYFSILLLSLHVYNFLSFLNRICFLLAKYITCARSIQKGQNHIKLGISGFSVSFEKPSLFLETLQRQMITSTTVHLIFESTWPVGVMQIDISEGYLLYTQFDFT